MRANTKVSVLRGERVESEYLDLEDTLRRISVSNPAYIQNLGTASSNDLRNSNTLGATCRIGKHVDVAVGDRLLDEVSGEMYSVDTLTSTRLINQEQLLSMTRL